MKLKFCGLRRPEDIQYVNAFPPDYAGFVFALSRRQVTPAQARTLSAGLSPAIQTVGIFVDAPLDTVLESAEHAGLSVIQLHGDEDAAYITALKKNWGGKVWKAVRVKDARAIAAADCLPVDALLLDAFSPAAYGGTGQTVNFDLVAQNRPSLPFFLAGGLTSDNIAEAIRRTAPYGIDLSSGLETDGVKDLEKIKSVYRLVRGI